MKNEFQLALQDWEDKKVIYNYANDGFEGVAYHNMKAAEERVMALVNEKKKEANNG